MDKLQQPISSTVASQVFRELKANLKNEAFLN